MSDKLVFAGLAILVGGVTIVSVAMLVGVPIAFIGLFMKLWAMK